MLACRIKARRRKIVSAVSLKLKYAGAAFLAVVLGALFVIALLAWLGVRALLEVIEEWACSPTARAVRG